MKKRLLSLLLCAVMFVGLLPAGVEIVSAEEYDYTDPDNPYIATDFDGLFEVFNKWRTDSATRYIRLGNDIIHTTKEGGGLGLFISHGAPVVLDLAGYKLGITSESYSRLFYGNKNAAITIEDSRRYDSSKALWIDGRVEYRYDDDKILHGESDSYLLAGEIIVKGGTFKNNTNISGKIHSIFCGASLEMFGGTFEADTPIVLTRGFIDDPKGAVIHDGTLRVNKEVAILTEGTFITSEKHPVIERCEIVNASGNEQVVAFRMQLEEDFAESHTAADAWAIWNEIVSTDVYAYIDDEIQPRGSHGVLYTTDAFIGPVFRTKYVLTPVTFVNNIAIHAANIRAGEELSYYAGAPSGTAYAVDSAYTTGKYWKDGVLWKNIAYDSHTILEVGKTYTVSFRVKLNEKYKYQFSGESDIIATVNGGAARVTLDGDVCIVHYTFTAEPNPIDKIALFVTKPKSGDSPVYTATVPSGADYCVETSYAVSGFQNGVSWMDGIAAMADGAKFVSGGTYNVLVMVNSTDYQISRFVDAGSIQATVNGKKANVIRYSANRYGIYYTFSLSNEITNMEITVPSTDVGEQFQWSASVPEDAEYSIRQNSSGVAANGVVWYIGDAAVTPGRTKYFEAGVTYKVTVSLEVKDADNFIFAAADRLTAFVNGASAETARVSDTRCVVSYTFTVEDLCAVVWYLDAASPEYTAGAEVPRGTVFGNPPEPGRLDADFGGWYTDRALTSPYDPTAPIMEDTELFPLWIPKNTYLLGDVNGDGEITDADAIYLLYHTFYPDEYPISQECDFNGDGELTDADAIYLLYYTFYPEEYPLTLPPKKED